MNIPVTSNVRDSRIPAQRGTVKQGFKLLLAIPWLYSLVHAAGRCMKQPDPFTAHHELKDIRKIGKILKPLASESMLMP